MMHTGTVALAGAPAPVQVSVSRHMVQISTVDGRYWQSPARRARRVSFEADELVLDLGGRRWRVALDDPARFRWSALPHLVG